VVGPTGEADAAAGTAGGVTSPVTGVTSPVPPGVTWPSPVGGGVATVVAGAGDCGSGLGMAAVLGFGTSGHLVGAVLRGRLGCVASWKKRLHVQQCYSNVNVIESLRMNGLQRPLPLRQLRCRHMITV
jgi:hypothetical protein